MTGSRPDPGLYERYRDAVERLETFVGRRSGLFEALARRREVIQDRLANFRHHHEHLDKSIVILLLGGTGTGKSTLINALAGQEISRTGVRRGLTDRYIVYHHVEANVSFLGSLTDAADEWVPHQRESLRHKILIDAPDFDSVKEFNNQKALSMLEGADLVLCVVTSEKYRDRTLHEVLARTSGLKKFYFVYNKVDLDFSERVERQLGEDLGRIGLGGVEVFRTSARRAVAGEVDPGVEALDRLLHDELDEARIREIKAANLDRLFDSIRQETRRALPADPAGAADRLEAGFGTALDESGRRIGAEVADRLFGEGATDLADLYRSLQYHAFSLVFGLYMSAVDLLRSVVTGARGSGRSDPIRLRSLVRGHARELPRDRIVRELTSLEDRLARSASGLGFAEGPIVSAFGPGRAEGLAEALSGRIAERVESAFRDEFDRLVLKKKGRVGSFFANLFYNALPTGFFLFAAGKLVYHYFWRTEFLGTDFVVSSLGVLFLCCLIMQVVAERHALRRRWAFLDRLEAEARGAVAETLDAELGAPVRQIVEEARAAAGEIEAIEGSCDGRRPG